MKAYLFMISFFFCAHFAQAQGLPDYKSTDNTGMGRQERFMAIEKYLAQVATFTQQIDKKVDQIDNKTVLELQEQSKKMQEQLTQLQEQNRQLQSELVQVKVALGGIRPEEMNRLKTFVDRLSGGEWERSQNEIEGLKITIRSLEGVIQSLNP